MEETSPDLKQWHVPSVVLSFIDAMRAADAFDLDSLAVFIEKPWKWEPEYGSWLLNGEPMDESCEGWNAWVEAMDAMQ